MDLDTLGFFLYMENQEAKQKAQEQKSGNGEPKEQQKQDDNKSRG